MSPLVDIARGYLGTPFHHQGRLPNVGLDCAGVVVCALKACGIAVTDVHGYGRIPANGLFMAAVNKHCDRVDLAAVQPGDLLMFRFRDAPQHIAIVSSVNPTRIIHAYQEVGKVVENSLDAAWTARLVGCYRLKVSA
jgi:NlpC/P60 family putative phage cell wall peptidase